MSSSYEFSLTLFRSPDLQRRDAIWPAIAAHLSGGRAPDAFNPCPVVLPDQFVPGPVFAALGSDRDCDGTTYHAYKIEARNLAEAKVLAEKYDDVYEVVTLGAVDWPADNDNWSERAYFMESGYCSLGANWEPWVRDDSIGIPALDHTYDEMGV